MKKLNFYFGAVAFYENGAVVIAFGLDNKPAWRFYCLKSGRGE